MEIWQYIEILKRPDRTWFFSTDRDNTEEKINALTKIAIDGYSSVIYSLTDFLKDKNKEIQEATCNTIIHIFNKINGKKAYYDSLKHCRISESDIDYYEANFPTGQFIELLAISSLNGNGYVREKAVKKLSQVARRRAIQFLIYRLADWVLPVRQAALKGIESYKSVEYIDTLIENLPILEWLQKVERTDLNGIYNGIIEFITSKYREYILANFNTYPDKLRLIIARHISTSLTNEPKELNLLLTDKHFIIRNLVLSHFDKLGENEIDQLLNDKSAVVRLQTLYCLKDRIDFKTTVQNYLADNSATIRHFARFTLKEAKINFSEFYNQHLQDNVQIMGSLSGLAEVDAKHFSERLKKYLGNNKIKIKKIAFLALGKLDEESAYEFALANLDSSLVGLRNVIIDFLSAIPRQEVLEKARDRYKNGNYELKKSMLRLFHKIGGWTAIPDLMIATVDESEFIRNLGKQYVETWKIRAINLFSTPKNEDLERANQIFRFTYELHEDKKYFSENPLKNGLDLYFK